MSHYPGLGREWIHGPGFVRWLEQVRPVEMNNPSVGLNAGGKSQWASDSDVRALFRAEYEAGTISLRVADRICVKLDLHIDTEMPEELWADEPRGKPKTEPWLVGLVRDPKRPGFLMREAA